MTTAKQLPHTTTDWKGYTLEEIRYARAYTAARMEINRDRLMSRGRDIQKNGLKTNLPHGIVGKMIGAFSYIDIALLTWKAARKLFRLTRIIKGK